MVLNEICALRVLENLRILCIMYELRICSKVDEILFLHYQSKTVVLDQWF
jgi:hypothetical protein